MNILIAGGAKQSGQIRGVQLGEALGAKVVSKPSESDVKWADVVVLIKWGGPKYAPLVHKFKKPLVWDALDFWDQPEQNHLTAVQSIPLLHTTMREMKPQLTIGATKTMAYDAGGVYLPHHSWYGLEPTTPRVTHHIVVGYQGTPKYLGKWHKALVDACYKRDWAFIINPPTVSECDILVSFRDGEWDGWMCRNWKSGVKAVNALVAGRPLISDWSMAVDEIEPAGSVIRDPIQLADALDMWGDERTRQLAYEDALTCYQQYSLPVVAEEYRIVLRLAASGMEVCQ